MSLGSALHPTSTGCKKGSVVHGVTSRDPCPPLVLFLPLCRGRDILEVFPFAPKPLAFRHLLWALRRAGWESVCGPGLIEKCETWVRETGG